MRQELTRPAPGHAVCATMHFIPRCGPSRSRQMPGVISLDLAAAARLPVPAPTAASACLPTLEPFDRSARAPATVPASAARITPVSAAGLETRRRRAAEWCAAALGLTAGVAGPTFPWRYGSSPTSSGRSRESRPSQRMTARSLRGGSASRSRRQIRRASSSRPRGARGGCMDERQVPAVKGAPEAGIGTTPRRQEHMFPYGEDRPESAPSPSLLPARGDRFRHTPLPRARP
jgi:hypothetical protein